MHNNEFALNKSRETDGNSLFHDQSEDYENTHVAIPRLLFSALAILICNMSLGQEAPPEAYFKELVASAYVEPFRSGDIELWIEAFDVNALALHNHRPLDRGVDAIQAFGRSVHQHFVLQEYEVEVTDVRQSEQWVYTVGRYRSHFISRADGSSPFGRSTGKFVLLWEKQPEGQWKIILDMGNSDSR